MKNRKQFDLLLIYVFFRRHDYYLNIVAELSKEYSIAVYDVNHKKNKNLKQTEILFKEELSKLGAVFIDDFPERCSVISVPNYVYEDSFIHACSRELHSTISISTSSTFVSRESLDQLLELKVTSIFPRSKYRLIEDIKKQGIQSYLDKFIIQSHGSPFKKYQVIKVPHKDYILAYPSHLGLTDETFIDWQLNVLKMLKSIPKDRIYLKKHNVRDSGNSLVNEKLVKKICLLPNVLIQVLQLSVSVLAKIGFIRKKMVSLRHDLLNALIYKKTTPLETVTEYANFGIEFFLPFINKGLITGKTTCIWYALYNKLPVYNCDTHEDVFLADNIKDGMNFFGVKSFGGRFIFDPSNFNKISEEERNADIVQIFRSKIEEAKRLCRV